MSTEGERQLQLALGDVPVDPWTGVRREKLAILAPVELAGALGVTETTLQTWRVDGYGPAYVRAGKRVFYRIDDVRSWIAQQTTAPKMNLNPGG